MCIPDEGFLRNHMTFRPLSRENPFHVEPFILSANRESGTRTSPGATYDTMSSSLNRSHSATASITSVATYPLSQGGSLPAVAEERAVPHVYVVHHDGGRPPVTVYTADGTEVVELPPRYNESGSSPNPSTRMPGQEQQQAPALPPKS